MNLNPDPTPPALRRPVGQRWPDAQKAAALATLKACGGNVRAASEKAGIPRRTLRRWASGESVSPSVALTAQDTGDDMAETVERLTRRLLQVQGAALEHLADALDDLDEAHLPAAVSALTNAAEKGVRTLRLLRGESTANVATGEPGLFERINERLGLTSRTAPGALRADVEDAVVLAEQSGQVAPDHLSPTDKPV